MKVRFGRIHADAVGFDDAVERIIARCKSGEGGYVVTPNVDHVCLAEDDDTLVEAYRRAFLALADGMPLVWISRALGQAITEKVSGSDLVPALLKRAAEEDLTYYVLGSRPEAAASAAAKIPARCVGMESPRVASDGSCDEDVLSRIGIAAPHLLLVALGCPKQEMFMHRHEEALRGIVSLGIGATIDFIAGHTRRAPRWMSRMGLEWTYRLAQDPRRLAHRYLVRDRKIVSVFLRMLRTRKELGF